MGMKSYIKRVVKHFTSDRMPKKVYIRPNIINNLNFQGKIVLVTGGSDGIGFEIAKKFSDCGAKVVITGRNQEKLELAAKKLKNTFIFQHDVSDIDATDSLIDYVYETFGQLDIVVSNAGVSLHEKDFLHVTPATFSQQFDINLKGGYFLVQKILKRQPKNLNIIFTTSERGDQCDVLPYGLTKAALNSLIQGLSCTYYKNNIRVNGIAPGVTCSNLIKKDKNSNLSNQNHPSGRFFIPEEVAEIATFLANDAANCISGEIVHCNAGNHLNPWW